MKRLIIAIVLVFQIAATAWGQNFGAWTTPVPFSKVADGSSIEWNINLAVVANGTVTLSHNRGSRFLNVSGLQNGGIYTLTIHQDSTGRATVFAGSGCTWVFLDGGMGDGVNVFISRDVSPNAVDVLTWIFDGQFCYANIQTFHSPYPYFTRP